MGAGPWSFQGPNVDLSRHHDCATPVQVAGCVAEGQPPGQLWTHVPIISGALMLTLHWPKEAKGDLPASAMMPRCK